MNSKYIVVRYEDGEHCAILFPNRVVHRDVASIHCVGKVYLVSAGFFTIDTEFDVRAWGASESLRGKFPSRGEEDADLITLAWNEMQV